MMKNLRWGAQVAVSRIDSKARCLRLCSAMDDDDRPRPKGDAASKLASEDLSPYSQEELEERISLLEAEIARVESHRLKAAAHRDAAEMLFRKPGS
jgi:uncharacterized small protein (DUF1192 family)